MAMAHLTFLAQRAIEAAGPSRPPLEQGGLGSEVPDGRIAPAGASAAEEHPQHLKGGLQQEQRQQEQQQQRRHREQQQQSGWQSTVNRREAEKFAKFSDEWWAPEGPFKPLHRMNPTRVRFITGALCDNFGLDAYQPEPLASLRVLDIGCGGGILAESLARQGAQVTGVDVNEAAVGAAEAHALQDQLVAARLQYRVAAAEQLVQEGRLFDAVIASEVIEHVTSLPHFCASLAHLTKPGGAVVVTTLNRTPRSLALAVVAAEYVLRWVPAGTHDWSKFLTPEELSMVMADGSGGAVTLEQLAGMQYNPLTGQWSLGTDTAINYAAYFRKQG
ncbi:hypothetical protein N2152v2_007543 [Parachlorella kessleri]